MRHLVAQYGGNFAWPWPNRKVKKLDCRADASAPLAFVEAEDKAGGSGLWPMKLHASLSKLAQLAQIMYFASDKLFLEWLLIHYKYEAMELVEQGCSEDNTNATLYDQVASKALQEAKA